jgi:hypothetical protein
VRLAIAYQGLTGDHLFPDCPHLKRSKPLHPGEALGRQCAGKVNVDGGWLCGWCVRVWKARNKTQ